MLTRLLTITAILIATTSSAEEPGAITRAYCVGPATACVPVRHAQPAPIWIEGPDVATLELDVPGLLLDVYLKDCHNVSAEYPKRSPDQFMWLKHYRQSGARGPGVKLFIADTFPYRRDGAWWCPRVVYIPLGVETDVVADPNNDE